MSLTTVAVYSITIHKKNQKLKDLEILSDFDNGSDLITMFKQLPSLLNDGSTTSILYNDEDKKKRLLIQTSEFRPFGRCIDGELESGDYGVETVFIDSKGNKKGKLEKDDSPMIPFYFLCDIQENVKKGYILFQRFKQFGVFSLFVKAFRAEFKKLHPEYSIFFNPLTSYKEFNRILDQAEIKKVSAISKDAKQYLNVFNPKNPSDQFNSNDTFLEISLVAKRNKKISIMNSIKKIIYDPNERVDKYFEVANLQDTPIKIYLKANDRNYTLDTTRIENFSPDIDISHLVELNNKGFPNINQVKEASIKILSDIKVEQERHNP